MDQWVIKGAGIHGKEDLRGEVGPIPETKKKGGG
jgi:hypothetical protein